jgi:hypothetical protein
VAQGTIQEGF